MGGGRWDPDEYRATKRTIRTMVGDLFHHRETVMTPTKLPDTKTHINRFEIQSGTSPRKYLVSQARSTLQWQCSCQGWITHRNCKHLKAIVPEAESVNTRGTPDDWKQAVKAVLGGNTEKKKVKVVERTKPKRQLRLD